MKTKELIRQLQEIDPEGETECCVDNEDIWFLESAPAYWDGRLQILNRNEKGHIISGKYTSKGSKIKIRHTSIRDRISDDTEFPVDYSEVGVYSIDKYKEGDDKWRAKVIEIEESTECKIFCSFVEKTYPEVKKEDAKNFYYSTFNRNDPFPEDLRDMHRSWYDRRCEQWSRVVKVENGTILYIE